MVWTLLLLSSASSGDTIFMTPPVVHTKSMALGATKGDAMATPTDKTNHTSMKRAIEVACLSRVMGQILMHENPASGSTLSHRFIQTDTAGYRDIQTLHAARHGNADQLIAGLAG